MPVYNIKKYPDPFLRRKAFRVGKITIEERKILAQMVETMYFADGIGLAGPQVGIDRQFVVVDVGEGLIKLVNPKIVFREGESLMEEGCLSVPGVFLNIKRAEKILVEGWDEKENNVQIAAEGLLAHVLQHEIDHLEGILIIDKAEKKEKKKFNLF
ncbi:peptide deformylase [Candidatus Aerophobetes bacterium]|nr:peptide deformylase [Candidatus Aerophobetes bacterium]